MRFGKVVGWTRAAEQRGRTSALPFTRDGVAGSRTGFYRIAGANSPSGAGYLRHKGLRAGASLPVQNAGDFGQTNFGGPGRQAQIVSRVRNVKSESRPAYCRFMKSSLPGLNRFPNGMWTPHTTGLAESRGGSLTPNPMCSREVEVLETTIATAELRLASLRDLRARVYASKNESMSMRRLVARNTIAIRCCHYEVGRLRTLLASRTMVSA